MHHLCLSGNRSPFCTRHVFDLLTLILMFSMYCSDRMLKHYEKKFTDYKDQGRIKYSLFPAIKLLPTISVVTVLS